MSSAAEFLNSIPAPVVLVGGILLLLVGGHQLVEGAAAIARRAGLSTLFVGLTIVAFGTSAPELFFNVIAAASGRGGLSFGNVIGSNIANIALVLGLAAVLHPLVVHSRVIRIELPQLIAVTGVLVAIAYLPMTQPLIDGTARPGFSQVDGIFLLIGFGIFATLCVRLGIKSPTDELPAEIEDEATSHPMRPLPVALLMFGGGLIALAAGGKCAETGAVGVAVSLGLPEEVVGLTIVALATSLPEVVTSIIAVRRGHVDIAVGNVVGSNLFNILLVLGTTTVIAPVPVPPFGGFDMAVMLLLTLALLPIAITHRSRITRFEGIGLLVVYVSYMTWTVVR